MTDALTDAIGQAMTAVRGAIPSQAPTVSVSGVRKSGSGTRPVSGVFSAVILSNGFADPLGDLAAASGVGSVSLMVLADGEGGWVDATPPEDGDLLTLEDGRKFAVTSVEFVRGLYYKIGARQC